MKKKKRETKKKYEKPSLRVISIAPGVQTLGIGCKLIDGTPAPGSPINCVANYCSTLGTS